MKKHQKKYIKNQKFTKSEKKYLLFQKIQNFENNFFWAKKILFFSQYKKKRDFTKALKSSPIQTKKSGDIAKKIIFFPKIILFLQNF